MKVTNEILEYYDDRLNNTELENAKCVKISLLGKAITDENNYALISIQDLTNVLNHVWYLGVGGYPFTYIRGSRKKMHNFFMGKYGKEYAIDHINRNRLDNRRENLRICTQKENSYNKSKSKNSKYEFKGVKLEKNGTYTAYASKDGKKHELKNYPDEISAAYAYDMIAEELFGKFAPKNFP